MEKCRKCKYYYKIYSFEECRHELSKHGNGLISYLQCYFMTSPEGFCGPKHKLFKDVKSVIKKFSE